MGKWENAPYYKLKTISTSRDKVCPLEHHEFVNLHMLKNISTSTYKNDFFSSSLSQRQIFDDRSRRHFMGSSTVVWASHLYLPPQTLSLYLQSSCIHPTTLRGKESCLFHWPSRIHRATGTPSPHPLLIYSFRSSLETLFIQLLP